MSDSSSGIVNHDLCLCFALLQERGDALLWKRGGDALVQEHISPLLWEGDLLWKQETRGEMLYSKSEIFTLFEGC